MADQVRGEEEGKTLSPNVVERVLDIGKITADPNWNGRSAVRTMTTGPRPVGDDESAPGVEGLAGALEVAGQRSRVIVRVGPKGEYILVAGFTRYYAVKWLAERGRTVKGLLPAQILAEVHLKMTEDEARLFNSDENIRNEIVSQDFCWQIKKIIEANKEITVQELAKRFSKSDSHMTRCVAIAKKLKSDLFERWRNASTRTVSFTDLALIAGLPKSEQDDAFAAALAAIEGSKKAADTKGWVHSACKRAAKIGQLVGGAHRDGVLVFNDSLDLVGDRRGAEPIRLLVPFKVNVAKRPVSAATVGRIAKAFTDAFYTEKNRVPEAVEEAEDEESDE